MAKRYQLRGHSGPVANQIVELIEPEITLGRDLSNDLVISDSEVSRSHARLSWRDDGYVIEDMRSTNGTWVNGHPVLRGSRLAAGDMVTLGKVSVFVYELVPEPVTDTTPNQDVSVLPEIIESTMFMPASQKRIPEDAGAHRARRSEPPAQTDNGQPPASAPHEQPRAPLPEPTLSPGRSFYREYLACLQAGNLDALLLLYHADATLLSVDVAARGRFEISQFFRRHFGAAGSFTAAPIGEPIEGPDCILCEISLETADTCARVQDGFVLRDGKATHHFTTAVETTPRSAGP